MSSAKKADKTRQGQGLYYGAGETLIKKFR